MDCSPPGSSVQGISQVRILEWVAISFSRKSSQPRDWTHISCIGRQNFLTISHHKAQKKKKNKKKKTKPKYLVITYNEKEYICITESFCSTPNKHNIVNQLYLNKKYFLKKNNKGLLKEY